MNGSVLMKEKYHGWLKPDFINEIERLNKIINELQKKTQKPKNERGAGRKSKLTRELHTDIMNHIKHGEDSYRAIAKALKISVGLVGKAKNMTDNEIEKLPCEYEPLEIVYEEQINIDDYAEKCARCGTIHYEIIGNWEWYACTECDFKNYNLPDEEDLE